MHYLISKKSVTPNPTAPPTTSKEQSQLPQLLATVESFTTLTEQESHQFATPGTLTRYLRARDHSIQKAASMLHASVNFHRSTPPPPVCPTCVKDPASHSFFPIGPAYGLTDATLGEVSPVMYSNFLVKDRETKSVTAHMQSTMDAAFDPNSTHRMVWVMDFAGFSRADVSPTNAKRVLTLFADHYPERLGCAVIYDAPRAFSALWSAVKLFAAPETVAKVIFVRKGDEMEGFGKAGIVGPVYERMMEEIHEAREGGTRGSWWERSPLPPLVDYGARILDARRKIGEIE